MNVRVFSIAKRKKEREKKTRKQERNLYHKVGHFSSRTKKSHIMVECQLRLWRFISLAKEKKILNHGKKWWNDGKYYYAKFISGSSFHNIKHDWTSLHRSFGSRFFCQSSFLDYFRLFCFRIDILLTGNGAWRKKSYFYRFASDSFCSTMRDDCEESQSVKSIWFDNLGKIQKKRERERERIKKKYAVIFFAFMAVKRMLVRYKNKLSEKKHLPWMCTWIDFGLTYIMYEIYVESIYVSYRKINFIVETVWQLHEQVIVCFWRCAWRMKTKRERKKRMSL